METLNFYKTPKNAYLSLGIGIVVFCCYKAWRFYLRTSLGLDPYNDYHRYEALTTYGRLAGAVISILSCYLLWHSRDYFYVFKNKKWIYFLTVFLIGQFAMMSVMTDVSYDHEKFLFELPINFLVGFFEEFCFRGLIFTALYRLFKFIPAAIISSLMFSVFHFDVFGQLQAFIFLFIYGLIMAQLFYKGVGLIWLSLVHFIWDQCHFGLNWYGDGQSLTQTIYLFIYVIFFFLLCLEFYIWRSKKA